MAAISKNSRKVLLKTNLTSWISSEERRSPYRRSFLFFHFVHFTKKIRVLASKTVLALLPQFSISNVSVCKQRQCLNWTSITDCFFKSVKKFPKIRPYQHVLHKTTILLPLRTTMQCNAMSSWCENMILTN